MQKELSQEKEKIVINHQNAPPSKYEADRWHHTRSQYSAVFKGSKLNIDTVIFWI